MARLLLLDENPGTREVLKTYLRDLVEVHTANFSELGSALASVQPELVLFSIEKLFPLKQLMPTIRQNPLYSQVGCVAVVSDLSPMTLDLLYECGVDDFLERPIDFTVLYFKLRTLLRRVQGGFVNLPAIQELGELKLFSQENRVQVEGTDLHVTSIQMKLLQTFYAQPDRLLTRDWLKMNVWKGEEISSRSIDAQISKLRALFPSLGAHLESVYGKGYIWRSQVQAAEFTGHQGKKKTTA